MSEVRSSRNVARKADLALQAQNKVRRRKIEQEFLRGMRPDGNYELSHMEEVSVMMEERKREMEAAAHASAIEDAPAAVEGDEQQLLEDRDFETIRCIHEFPATITCMDTTQGGGTLWTGEEDGSIGIRNGATGKPVYSIAKHGDCTVTVLYPTTTHMWVGLSDGTVRIYDHLVYILATQAKFHNDAVTAFAQTFDGKMFSASADSSIVKWDSQQTNFEVMAKWNVGSSPRPLRTLTCYGYSLFCAGDGCIVSCLDTETGAQLNTFERHTGPVHALLVADGFLFSASEDSTVRVWSIDMAEELAVLEHDAPVKALIADAVAHHVWSADDSGHIRVWESLPDQFKHVTSFTTGHSVKDMKALIAVDAVKIWSLSSNGQNRIWHSATNRLSDSITTTLDAMNAVLDQDVVELSKWRELIRVHEAIVAKATRDLLEVAVVSSTDTVRRTFLGKWVRWLRLRYAEKKRRSIQNTLAKDAEKTTLSVYFHRLMKSAHNRKAQREKQAISEKLHDATQNNLALVYFKKMMWFAKFIRKKEKAYALADMLRGHADAALRFTYFKKFASYVDMVRRNAKKNQLGDNLARGTARGLRQAFFVKWQKYGRLCRQKKARAPLADQMCSAVDNSMAAKFYHNWRIFAKSCQQRRQRDCLPSQQQQFHRRLLLRAFYTKWRKARAEHRDARARIALEEGAQKVEQLRQTIKDKQHLTGRLRILDAAQATIDDAVAKRVLKEKRILDLKNEIEELKRAIELKKTGAKEKQKSVQDEVHDLMAALKVKVLNLHHDYVLISKIREKGKQIPPTRIFLEAHAAVKRVVVEMTGAVHLKVTEEWPLTTESIRKMKGHHVEAVLQAIKTMIIGFDIMTKEMRDSLDTDEEIVVNAKWLMEFAEMCVEMRQKRFGKAGANRVKD